jgi:hypothetical protein
MTDISGLIEKFILGVIGGRGEIIINVTGRVFV